ncbi:MAG: fatty acid desaturase [Rhodospirillales bacterium]|nr:MAG: fatty acid desaturase [Rhodospirillales bacterium]
MSAPTTQIDFKNKSPEYFKTLADHCASFKGADTKRSITQMTVTLALFTAALIGLTLSVQSGNWLLYALLLIPTGGLLTRIFIFQHDCGHGSYFKTRKANDNVGRALSILTWTPYSFWRRTHNMHHASSGNLDKRGYGGIETITLNEFKSLPPAKQRFYRLYRNAYLLLGLGTPLFVLVVQRFLVTEPFLPEIAPKANMKNAWKSIYGLNLALMIIYGTLGLIIGFSTLTLVYLPVLIITSWIGGWLFYIQHQFENAHWERQEQWSYNQAALMGSSYYDLPPIIQWFTGNIGLHHIHHLNATIPNYKLQSCLDAHPDLKHLNHMNFKDSLKSIKLALWDETRRKMISFEEMDKQAA